MGSYITDDLRSFIVNRAKQICEYCLIHEQDTNFGCQIDHIISLKHGGTSDPGNLAYACVFCNRYKRSDIGSVLLPSQEMIRFFNPRTDRWSDHFRLEGAIIVPLTEIGKVTSQILDFNNINRVLERQTLITAGKYPPFSIAPSKKEYS